MLSWDDKSVHISLFHFLPSDVVDCLEPRDDWVMIDDRFAEIQGLRNRLHGVIEKVVCLSATIMLLIRSDVELEGRYRDCSLLQHQTQAKDRKRARASGRCRGLKSIGPEKRKKPEKEERNRIIEYAAVYYDQYWFRLALISKPRVMK